MKFIDRITKSSRFLLALACLTPLSLPGADMEIGTNLWFRANWSGELPFKANTDFAAAWNNGKSGYLLKTNIWSQSFLDDQAPFSVIRFMDWNTTNGNQQVSWDQRTLPTKSVQSTAPSEGGTGIAYEWMIDLCNRLGVNMWINLPVRANDDYMVQLATLLRDTLDPSLQIYVELSNEVWNFADQGDYAASAGLGVPAIAGVTNQSEREQKWMGYRSAQMWSIFRTVFGSQFDARIVRTMCGQSTNSWVAKWQLDALYSPTINTTGERPDVYGIAPYFAGKNLDGNLPNILQVNGDITQGLLYRDIFVERQEGAGVDSGKDTPLDNVDTHRSRLDAVDSSIRLVAYEGGQHIKTNAVAPNRSPYMYEVYKVYLDALAAHGLSLFNHYTTVGYFSGGGCWGAKEFTGQDAAVAHKYRALVDWIATNDSIPGAPVIKREPVDALLAVGEDNVFHVLADGNYKLTYQWQIDTGTGWTDLSGETSNAVTVTNAQASQNLHKYRCRITNTEATIYSAPATLYVGEAPNLVPAIATVSLPDGEAGRIYQSTVTATSGNPPLTFSLISGPAWLKMGADGNLSGLAVAGSFPVNVRVTDTDGDFDERQFTLTVLEVTTLVPTLETASLPNGKVGNAYSAQLMASGGDGELAFSMISPPGWLSIDASGNLTGNPPVPGTFNVKVRVADMDGDEDSATLVLTIDPASGGGGGGGLTAAFTGTAPTIDGDLNESLWTLPLSTTRSIIGASDNSIQFEVRWDATALYVAYRVLDANLIADGGGLDYTDDSLEVYFDLDNVRGPYDRDNSPFERQILRAYSSPVATSSGVTTASKAVQGGYTGEMKILWSAFSQAAAPGKIIGFDIGCNDDDNGGTRDSQVMAYGDGNNWKDTSNFASFTLTASADSPFKQWLENMGGNTAADPAIDPTGEGISLLERYAFGFSPDQAVTGRMPQFHVLTSNPAHLVLDPLSVDPEATGVAVIVQTCHALGNDWTEAFRYVAGAETANGATVTARTPNAEGNVDLALSLNRADGGSNAGFFCRVIVQQVP